MTRPARRAVYLLVLALCLSTPGNRLLAQDVSGDSRITIVKPSFLEPAFGQVEVLVELAPELDAEKVDLVVDGRVVGELTKPPYEATVDVGQRNRGHRFDALVHLRGGEVLRSRLETPAIRVDEQLDLGLQQLYVTVTADGQRVLDLSRDDFEVVDDGKKQDLVTFEHEDVPLTAVLLVDASESMQGTRLKAATAGARAFIEDMRPLDEAMLLLFSDHVVKATEFSEDKDYLTGALDDVHGVGGTALNDHLYLALNYLDGRQGRRVVVLLSDGVDILSVLRMEEVLWRARHSQALIYWIHLAGTEGGDQAPQLASAWRDVPDTVREFETLKKTVEESGGRAEFLASAEDLAPAYREILQELREQYALGYYPTDLKKDGRWRPVRVRVDRSGTAVRVREGYLDY
ncbi:MAG: VWA domain-containing protein [Acidobacteria bacterium]|nr:VWA domain-containing protein [Acidobacteriota bacterium]